MSVVRQVDALLVFADAQLSAYSTVLALIERASPFDRHTGQRVFNLTKFRSLVAQKRAESEFVVKSREAQGATNGT